MSITDTRPAEDQPTSAPPVSGGRPRSGARRGFHLHPLALRLHFYAGFFVAPFILIAALTGALYAIAPTIEGFVSRDLLRVATTGPEQPLAAQVDAAVATRPELTLVAVAPAPEQGETTRVLFNDPTLGDSERLSVFVDPQTAQPVGEAVVYGSSGALPLRAWLSEFHRSLHLGDTGRLYSELAASWLWVIALFGLVLWVHRVRKRRARTAARWLLAPDLSQPKRRKLNWHGAIGIWILPVVLLLSATGMSWSTHAGESITKLRQEMSWTTPAVSATLPGAVAPTPSAGGDHHSAGHVAPVLVDPAGRIAQLDRVYEVARANAITQGVEIAIPATPDKAFTVKEIRRPGTYTIDSIAVDGETGAITDRLPYADWPLMAKLTNWGIAFHMGLLFGLPNQLLLLAIMIGLIAVLVLGYLMWWQRRPTRKATRLALAAPPRRGVLRRTSPWLTVALVLAAVAVGWFIPLVGLSLLAFLIIDVALGLAARAQPSTH
ncbi:PepSY-associated TM helix domain-containing protein [Nocardia mangyaensis]|uniref:PepSY-associated TM helix domain-containing protein n=1 Tax=Nocardia mangyaensis TaxID=2213200 RepID=UPI0026774DDD|nr:PepSY-associated TM helix domain-containing protein [Nocardia mangyaensis]MDO3645624.1 PepSY-associated TM helix domain-containing protein [Nocardia mangyaensis]